MLVGIKSKHLCSLEEERYIIAEVLPTGRGENFRLVYSMADERGRSWCALCALACRWPELSRLLAKLNWTMLRIQRKQVLSLYPDKKQITSFGRNIAIALLDQTKGQLVRLSVFPSPSIQKHHAPCSTATAAI